VRQLGLKIVIKLCELCDLSRMLRNTILYLLVILISLSVLGFVLPILSLKLLDLLLLAQVILSDLFQYRVFLLNLAFQKFDFFSKFCVGLIVACWHLVVDVMPLRMLSLIERGGFLNWHFHRANHFIFGRIILKRVS